MGLTVKEVKKMIQEKEYILGEDLFEYHELNIDLIRDLFLDGFKAVLPQEAVDEIIENDIEMFCFRDITENLMELDDNIAEELAPVCSELFYKILKDILNTNEEYMTLFLESLID